MKKEPYYSVVIKASSKEEAHKLAYLQQIYNNLEVSIAPVYEGCHYRFTLGIKTTFPSGKTAHDATGNFYQTSRAVPLNIKYMFYNYNHFKKHLWDIKIEI